MTTETQTATLRIERIMKAPPERVYKAYLDRTRFARLNSGQGHATNVETLEPKVGGAFRYTMAMNDGSRSQAYVGKFLELTEFTKIRHSYAFDTDMPAMKTPMEISITFHEVPGGTKVLFEQFGLPAPIPVEGATKGWTMMLDQWATLVETA